jgi:HlyD family secretion protein
MTATADIVVKDLKNALLIPSTALRFSPPVEQESKAYGDLLQSLIPRPPRGSAEQNRDTSGGTGQQRIWLLKDDRIYPVAITTGEASGGLTEVVAGDIEPGMDAVTDYIESRT